MTFTESGAAAYAAGDLDALERLIDSAAQAEVEGRAMAIRKWNELYEAQKVTT